MPEIELPRISSKKQAEAHILQVQSQLIIERNKNRILREYVACQYDERLELDEDARRVLELTED